MLVSTGQKVANLPPVLELAQAGDHFLWIESDEAERLGWTRAPQKILERFGMVSAGKARVAQVNDPSLIKSNLDPIVKTQCAKYENVYLVMNGGTKLVPLGLVLAFRDYRPYLLYGDERPAVCRIYPADLSSPARVLVYRRASIDLEEILHLNGYTLAKGSRHRKIWPGTMPADIESERYGEDESYTVNLHAAHHQWYLRRKMTEQVRFEDIRKLAPKGYQTWLRTMRQMLYGFNVDILRQIYYATMKLRAKAQQVASTRASQITPPQARLGEALERAVARRILKWLAANDSSAVESVWMGVSIARETQPDITHAEFDILIVLKNGVLLHLECKSADVEFRSFDVNTFRLRSAGSQLARSVIVVPIYTRHQKTEWFAELSRNWEEIQEKLGPEFIIPFTLPGQPVSFTMGEGETVRTVKCGGFEEHFSKLLRPYCASE